MKHLAQPTQKPTNLSTHLMKNLLTPSAFKSSPEALKALESARLYMDLNDYSHAIAVLVPFVESGDRNVLFSLGFAHEQRRQKGDRKLGTQYLNQAADLGHFKATQICARRKLTRWIGCAGYIEDLRPFLVTAGKAFLPQEILESLDFDTVELADLISSVKFALEKVAKRSDYLASATLAVLLLHEETVDEETQAYAVALLKSAIEDGNLSAARFLGRAYLEGSLIVADHVKAFEIFRDGELMKCNESRHRLAECYLRGQGVGADVHKAIELLKQNINEGHPYSPCVLGALYIEGTKVPQNLKMGLQYLKISAFRRCAPAAAQIAQCLLYHPYLATIGYERQAYAYIAHKLGDASQLEQISGVPPEGLPEMNKSVELIKATNPSILL